MEKPQNLGNKGSFEIEVDLDMNKDDSIPTMYIMERFDRGMIIDFDLIEVIAYLKQQAPEYFKD